MNKPRFLSTKTYPHSIGLSTCFRQWRADSHCRFLHGYSLEVRIEFIEKAGLDERNWVIDFGSLKPIKQWLEETFDHKTVVAHDDPRLDEFQYLDANGLIQLVIVDSVGCEAFAELIYTNVDEWLKKQPRGEGVDLYQIEVKEHAGNSAIARNPKYVGVN